MAMLLGSWSELHFNTGGVLAHPRAQLGQLARFGIKARSQESAKTFFHRGVGHVPVPRDQSFWVHDAPVD